MVAGERHGPHRGARRASGTKGAPRCQIPFVESGDRQALERFARERHVHYEIAAEEVSGGERAEVAAFEVRLFATPGETPGEGLEPPGSRRHVELLRELRAFAERLVVAGDAAGRAEIVPTTAPALYESTEVPDAQEAALTVRIRCEAPGHRAGGGEDRCLGEIRDRLAALGVPRR
jgi:hypothetical protein